MLEGRDRHRALDLVATHVVYVYPARHTSLDATENADRYVHRPSWPSTIVSSVSSIVS